MIKSERVFIRQYHVYVRHTKKSKYSPWTQSKLYDAELPSSYKADRPEAFCDGRPPML